MRGAVLAVQLAVLSSGSALAQAPARAEPAPQTKEVVVGIHVNQISAFSLEDNSFFIEAYLWFRWDPTQWPGEEAGNGSTGATGTARALPYQTFEIIGSRDMSVEMNGLSPGLAVIRVRATIANRLDLNRFPFDNHVLGIAIEDLEKLPEVRLLADTAGSTIGPDVFVNGWNVGALTATSSETTYRTNFGDFYLEATNETVYSRVTFGIPLRRSGQGLFWKTYIGLLMAVCVALLSFFVPLTSVEPRVGLSVGALFAAIGSQWIIGENLPASTTWSLSDQLHALGYATIFCALGLTVVRLSHAKVLEETGKDPGRHLDLWLVSAVTALWAIAIWNIL